MQRIERLLIELNMTGRNQNTRAMCVSCTATRACGKVLATLVAKLPTVGHPYLGVMKCFPTWGIFVCIAFDDVLVTDWVMYDINRSREAEQPSSRAAEHL